MKKMLNTIFLILKWILIFIAFAFTFYIVLSMYDRLNKNIIESLNIFIPYIILLILFFINAFIKQNNIIKNIFYNLTCCIVFIVILLVCIRTIYDSNMLLNQLMGYKINFYYFNDFLIFMKILLYGLSIANVFFMFDFKIKDSSTNIEIL